MSQTMILENPRIKIIPIMLLLIRLVVGWIMVVHGWGKLQGPEKFIGYLASMDIPLPVVSGYLAIAGELLGGLGLMAGLLTPIAAFGIASTMAMAVFKVHWASGLLSQDNGFEYPVTILVISIFFIVQGAGPLSFDYFLEKKFSKRKIFS